MTEPEEKHRRTGEGGLHELTDDDYFTALETMPPVYDAEGRQVTGLFDDVQDLRAEKAAERGPEK